jgi:large subunit ribosomal protein L24
LKKVDKTIQTRSVSAPLSEELSLKHGVGKMDVRKGDTVIVARGNFRGVEGKVTSVDRKSGRIFVEGVSRERADGTTRLVSIHASKVIIRQLVLDDKRRKDILERRARSEPKNGGKA